MNTTPIDDLQRAKLRAILADAFARLRVYESPAYILRQPPSYSAADCTNRQRAIADDAIRRGAIADLEIA